MVYKNVKELMPKHFCQEYRAVFALLEQEGIFGPNYIPQLQDMSNFLNSKSSDDLIRRIKFAVYIYDRISIVFVL